jgi:hypothetical protein
MRPKSKVRHIHTCLGRGTGILTDTEYVSKYATKDAADEAGDDEESEDEMSSVGSYDEGEEEDDEVAGNMEEL